MHIVQIHVCVIESIWPIVRAKSNIDIIAWIAHHWDTDDLAAKIVDSGTLILETLVHVAQDSDIIEQYVEPITVVIQDHVAIISENVIAELQDEPLSC